MKLPVAIISQEAREWLLIFSGFGQDARVWEKFAQRCKQDFNVMVISLPSGSGNRAIGKEDFREAVLDIMQQYRMEQVVTISYSMGSRFNLAMAECLPEGIRAMILMAPDGVLRFTWNRIATTTAPGHWLFRQFVWREGFYQALIKLLYKVGILTKSLYSFSKWYMRDRAARVKVYDTWMMMRKLQPDLDLVNKHQQQFGFSLSAYFGLYDTVIQPKAAKRFRAKVKAAKIIMLEKGHQLMDEEMMEKLLNTLHSLKMIGSLNES